MKILAILILSVFLQQSDVEGLKTKARDSFNKAEAKLLDKPDTPDVVKKCPCDGKGYIIHGDGHKTECPGNDEGPCKFKGSVTKAAPKAEPVVVKEHGLIIMETRPSCFLCEQVKASQQLRDILKKGWRFKYTRISDADRSPVPKFHAYMGGKRFPLKDISNSSLNLLNKQFSESLQKK